MLSEISGLGQNNIVLDIVKKNCDNLEEDMIDAIKKDQEDSVASVSKQELNSWKRGFTPQAEIWNGRMAIIGLFIGILLLILINSSIFP